MSETWKRLGLVRARVSLPARQGIKRAAATSLRVLSALLSPLFAFVARTGVGSDSALRRGFVPVATHFYQPVFDPADIPDSFWEGRQPLPGVRLDLGPQLAFLDALSEYAAEARWPAELDRGALRYYTNNPSFGYSSACLLHSLVRHAKPRRIVEVGAGISTLLFAEALVRNGREGHECQFCTIDPYPPAFLEQMSLASHTVLRERVELVDSHAMLDLTENDILFIDSSHVVRTAGDVNHLYLNILPRLAAGVIVHVHDIQLPYEYPRIYSAREAPPRVYWTEQYLLHAFLTFNDAFRVLACGYHLQRDYPHEFRLRFPGWDPLIHRPTSSFYMQRV